MKKYFDETMQEDIDWLQGFGIDEAEARGFIKHLLESEDHTSTKKQKRIEEIMNNITEDSNMCMIRDALENMPLSFFEEDEE